MKRLLLTLVFLLLPLGFVAPAHAQITGDAFKQFFGQTFTGQDGGTQVFSEGGDLKKDLPKAVGNVISLFLSLIGVILLVLVVYAGFLWLTAGGNDDQVAHAKQLIRNGVIGLVIALSAYLITGFVVTQVQNALSSQTGTPAAGAGAGK